jgi:molybdopterin converting factor small subunit
MKIKVTLSSLLRQFSGLTKEPNTIEVTAPNPLECLRILTDQFPPIRQWVYDKEGNLLPSTMFFVNREKLLPHEFARPLKDGDELFILLSFAGG